MKRWLSKTQTALAHDALKSERSKIAGQLDRNWESVLKLETRIEAVRAVGVAPEDLVEKQEALRRRSDRLAERGERIDQALSELIVLDNGIAGARWRPTQAEPF